MVVEGINKIAVIKSICYYYHNINSKYESTTTVYHCVDNSLHYLNVSAFIKAYGFFNIFGEVSFGAV